MNLQSDENGLRYVFAVSAPNKKLRLKKVNVDNVPTEELGHVIRCKRVASLREVVGTMKDDNNTDDVELTVVPATENTVENTVPATESNVDSENSICEETPSKKQKSDISIEQSSSKIKVVQFSNNRALIRSNSATSYSHNSSADDDDSEYVCLNNYSPKRITSESQERRQGKYKVFRDEWLDIDIFRDWLDRDPTNPRRARCVACNTTMNAGKSELEKHAAGARHERAVEAMHQSMMLQLAAADAEAGEQETEDIIEDEESSNDTARQVESTSIPSETAHPIIMEQSVSPEELVSWREQQIDAMNRVATAVESLSSNVALLLERLSSQQSEIITALHELGKK